MTHFEQQVAQALANLLRANHGSSETEAAILAPRVAAAIDAAADAGEYGDDVELRALAALRGES